MDTIRKNWIYGAAALSAVAGLIHSIAAPEHFEEWSGYGVFFVVVSTCQIVYALILLASKPPERDLLWVGIFGTIAIIGLWLVTRTVGVPFFGPEAWEVESVGVLDSLSKITEVALIMCLLALLRARPTVVSAV